MLLCEKATQPFQLYHISPPPKLVMEGLLRLGAPEMLISLQSFPLLSLLLTVLFFPCLSFQASHLASSRHTVLMCHQTTSQMSSRNYKYTVWTHWVCIYSFKIPKQWSDSQLDSIRLIKCRLFPSSPPTHYTLFTRPLYYIGITEVSLGYTKTAW